MDIGKQIRRAKISYFIASKGCYDVIRKHGKKVVVMEPVKGGVLAKVPEI